MKKIIAFLFLCITIMTTLTSVAFADPYYDFGYALGSAMEEHKFRKGYVDKNVYKDPNFNFSKLKRMYISTKLEGNESDIFEYRNFMAGGHNNVVYNRLSPKLPADTKVIQVEVLTDVFLRNNPQYSVNNPSQWMVPFINYLRQVSNGAIIVKIRKYQEGNGFANVDMTYSVVAFEPYQKPIEVFSFTESKYRVPYKSRFNLDYEITNDFVNKFSPLLHKR